MSVLYVCRAEQITSIGENKCWEKLQFMSIPSERQYKIAINSEANIFHNITGFIYADFYIQSTNVIIEYNGEQHYKYNDYLQKSYDKFIDQVNRDLYLKQYCKENNIKLLVIPYVDDKRIPKIIEKFITLGEDITTKLEPHLLPAIVENNCRSLVKYGQI